MSRGKLLAIIVAITLVLGITASLWAAEVPRHETLIVDVLTGRIANPANFNAWATWVGNDKGLQQLLYDPLWIAEYATGEIISVLASDLPVYNDDFTQMTVKLRPGIHWSDGVEFTADDVVYTVELLKNTRGMFYHTEFSLAVDKVYKTDDYTVVFDLKKPHSRFHGYFLDRWGACRIFPKHIWEKVEDPLSYECYPPIGTGPYVLKDYDVGGYWFIYEKRDDWDKTATGILFGEPKPKYVQFMYYGGAEKRVMAQAQHQLDMADLTPEAFKVLSKRNKHTRGVYEDFPWAEVLHPCVTGAQFNCAVAPYDNKEIRWALILALDIREIAMTAYDGGCALTPAFVPATIPYYEWYYDRLQTWLEEFALDVGDSAYKPYDSNIPAEIAELARKRGYNVPTEPERIRELFGYGWWRYAPEVAEKLLTKNGFTRDSKGKWLLPDGKPWTIEIIANPNPAHPGFKWAFPLAEQWKKFGIDAKAVPLEQRTAMISDGDYGVNTDWPISEPWGSDPDLHRSFRPFHSDFYTPLGERAVGHTSRWTDSRLDTIIDEMELIPFDDPEIIDKGVEGLKVLVEEMPGISIAAYPSFLGWDEYYWTNYPGGENIYTQPHYHWPNFKFMLPFLEPTGRK
jgi:peptide/nickel transport system substrate-binding protein